MRQPEGKLAVLLPGLGAVSIGLYLAQGAFVGPKLGEVFLELAAERDIARACAQLNHVAGIVDHVHKRDCFLVQLVAPRFDPGKVENFIDDIEQVLARAVNVVDVFAVGVVADRAEDLRFHHFGKAEDGIERRAQFMAHVREEPRLRPGGGGQRGVRLRELRGAGGGPRALPRYQPQRYGQRARTEEKRAAAASAARAALLVGVLGFARQKLYAPDAIPDRGEFDDLLAPRRALREAMVLAGGSEPARDGLARGLTGGEMVRETLAEGGATISRVVWRHGAPMRPFEAHQDLDGATFDCPDLEACEDERLRVRPGDEWIGRPTYVPGDHQGDPLRFADEAGGKTAQWSRRLHLDDVEACARQSECNPNREDDSLEDGAPTGASVQPARAPNPVDLHPVPLDDRGPGPVLGGEQVDVVPRSGQTPGNLPEALLHTPDHLGVDDIVYESDPHHLSGDLVAGIDRCDPGEIGASIPASDLQPTSTCCDQK